MEDIAEILKKILASPKSYSLDGEQVTQHDLDKVIDALQYLQKTKNAKAPHYGIRFGKSSVTKARR